MRKRLRHKGKRTASLPGGEDRLSALSDDVIQLLLSFLPSREAVRTCVLGQRWRTLWKSVPSLRIDIGVNTSESAGDCFNSLLRYRDRTPLRECEILSDPVLSSDVDQHIAPWLLYAISCQVRVLRIEIFSSSFRLSTGIIISEHLTRIYVYGVDFEDFSLDVLSCQSLEELELNRCEINIGNNGIDFPKSLRLLRIRNSGFLPEHTRSFISAPGLVTLELADCFDFTPWLKSLPSLVTAFIRIGDKCFCGVCDAVQRVECCDLDDGVILKGLSGARV